MNPVKSNFLFLYSVVFWHDSQQLPVEGHAMPLADLEVSLPANFVNGSIRPASTWGNLQIGSQFRIPPVAAFTLQMWSSGSQVGRANQLCLIGSASLTSSSPVSVDLQAIQNPFGEIVSFAEINLLIVLNDDTADANHLVVRPHATNGWTAPFADMTAPADGRLRVGPGYVHPVQGDQRPGVLIIGGANLSAYPVSATNKVIQVTTPKATNHVFRMIVAGRTSAS